jgi:hypothetical protein
MRYQVHVRSQHAKRGRGQFSGPDTYMGWIAKSGWNIRTRKPRVSAIRVQEAAGSEPEWVTPCDARGWYYVSGVPRSPDYPHPEYALRFARGGSKIYRTSSAALRAAADDDAVRRDGGRGE